MAVIPRRCGGWHGGHAQGQLVAHPSRLGTRTLDSLAPADVAGLVTALHEFGLKRESIRKTISTLAQVFDFAKVAPNPARDKTVKLPREDKAEINPPTAEHILAVHHLLLLPIVCPRSCSMRRGCG